MTAKTNKLDFSVQKQFAFKFAYIGKNYDGLVIQAHTQNTIEGVIFNTWKRCSYIEQTKTNEEIISDNNYSRCGRTDKGVNSSGNVFSISLRYNEKYNYMQSINHLLPEDINILGYTFVDDSFDSRFSCLYREYKYYFLKKDMNITKMNAACKWWEGVHNFKRFCKLDKSDVNYENKNYERRIFSIAITKCENFLFNFNVNNNTNINGDYYEPYVCVIQGSAFWWHQVRCMMAILFLIGCDQEEIGWINDMWDVTNDFEFRYGIADDRNLVWSDCVYEFVNFEQKEEVTAGSFFKMEKLFQQNWIDIIVNTHFFNVLLNSNKMFNGILNNEEWSLGENVGNVIGVMNSGYRRKQKYTKMLQQKKNRELKKKNTK